MLFAKSVYIQGVLVEEHVTKYALILNLAWEASTFKLIIDKAFDAPDEEYNTQIKGWNWLDAVWKGLSITKIELTNTYSYAATKDPLT